MLLSSLQILKENLLRHFLEAGILVPKRMAFTEMTGRPNLLMLLVDIQCMQKQLMNGRRVQDGN